jgi:hypothetical protein
MRNEALYSSDWIDYIHREAKAHCEKKDWRVQVRRKWSVRCKPVSDQVVSSLEWKLLPQDQPTVASDDPYGSTSNEGYEGTYYVLSYEYDRNVFVLQHSTIHVGLDNPSHDVTTFSEIQVPTLEDDFVGFHRYFFWDLSEPHHPDGIPPARWLRCHLQWLTDRFPPNRFCYT